MESWREINREIAACRAGLNPVECLERLFARFRDGHVAMALGEEHQRAGHNQAARRWYEEAAQCYRREEYQARARAAIARLGPPATKAQPKDPSQAGPHPRSGDLHVVSCSRRKAWNDPSVTDRFLPARDAYKGDEITAWLRRPESASTRWVILSAQYGFIEPDHPICNYDVTFNEPRTGPITDDALRAQVEHQVRWPDGRSLRTFDRVVVHGSEAYVGRVRAAFAGTGVVVVSANTTEPPTGSQAAPQSATVDRSRAEAIGRSLVDVPTSCYERLDTHEPEWPILQMLTRVEHPWGVLAALAFGLSDYQLGPGGAKAYWASIGRRLVKQPVDSRERLTAFVSRLVEEPVSSRLAVQKVSRVARLLASDLPDWCREKNFHALGQDADALWTRVAAVLGQAPDAKTIAFSMKCFDLLFKASTGSYSRIECAPIIVDLRIARVSLTSGLLHVPGRTLAELLETASTVAITHHKELIEGWSLVRESAQGLSLFRIDSLLWQVAEVIYHERSCRSVAVRRTAEALTTVGVDSQAATRTANELTAALAETQS